MARKGMVTGRDLQRALDTINNDPESKRRHWTQIREACRARLEHAEREPELYRTRELERYRAEVAQADEILSKIP